MNRWGAQEGFTLVELMVVLAILGIIGLIAVPRYNSAVETAKLTSLRANAQQIQSAMEQYRAEYKKFPTEGDFKSLDTDNTKETLADLKAMLSKYTDAASNSFLKFDPATKKDGYSVSPNQKTYALVLRYTDQNQKTHHFVITPESVREYLDSTNDVWDGTIMFNGSNVSVSSGANETLVED